MKLQPKNFVPIIHLEQDFRQRSNNVVLCVDYRKDDQGRYEDRPFFFLADPAETEIKKRDILLLFLWTVLPVYACLKCVSPNRSLSTVKYPLMSLESALLTTSVCFVSDSHLNCKHDAKLKIVFHPQRKSLVLRLQSTLTTLS